MLHTVENSVLEVAKSVSIEQEDRTQSVFSRHWRRLIIGSCLCQTVPTSEEQSASPIVLVVVVLVLGRFPVVRANFPPLAFPSSFYSSLAIGPNP
jgi:hypothetical protein